MLRASPTVERLRIQRKSMIFVQAHIHHFVHADSLFIDQPNLAERTYRLQIPSQPADWKSKKHFITLELEFLSFSRQNNREHFLDSLSSCCLGKWHIYFSVVSFWTAFGREFD